MALPFCCTSPCRKLRRCVARRVQSSRTSKCRFLVRRKEMSRKRPVLLTRRPSG